MSHWHAQHSPTLVWLRTPTWQWLMSQIIELNCTFLVFLSQILLLSLVRSCIVYANMTVTKVPTLWVQLVPSCTNTHCYRASFSCDIEQVGSNQQVKQEIKGKVTVFGLLAWFPQSTKGYVMKSHKDRFLNVIRNVFWLTVCMFYLFSIIPSYNIPAIYIWMIQL